MEIKMKMTMILRGLILLATVSLLFAQDVVLKDDFESKEVISSGCCGPPYTGINVKGEFTKRVMYKCDGLTITKILDPSVKKNGENSLKITIENNNNFSYFYFYRQAVSLPVNQESGFYGWLKRDADTKVLIKPALRFSAQNTEGKMISFDFRIGGYGVLNGLSKPDKDGWRKIDAMVWKDVKKICDDKKLDIKTVRFAGWGVYVNGKIETPCTFYIDDFKFETPAE